MLVLWAIVPAWGQLAPNPSAISNPETATTKHAAVISLSASDFASANALIGQRVNDIQFQGIEFSKRVLPRMQGLIVQRPGEPLDRKKVRASIEALYGTGKFANLQAEAQQAPQGEVTLVFRGTPNYFVGSVTAQGAPKRPTDTQLTDATKLQLGEMFTEQKGVQAVARSRRCWQRTVSTRQR